MSNLQTKISVSKCCQLNLRKMAFAQPHLEIVPIKLSSCPAWLLSTLQNCFTFCFPFQKNNIVCCWKVILFYVFMFSGENEMTPYITTLVFSNKIWTLINSPRKITKHEEPSFTKLGENVRKLFEYQ